MFGFSLREKTEAVIKELFIFYVEDVHRPIFESIVEQAKAANQNEYSAAFFYMLIRMNMMVQPFDSEIGGGLIDPKDGRTEEETKQVQDFIQNHTSKIYSYIHLANSPESDIQEWLTQVLINSNLINSGKNNQGNADASNETLEKLMEGMEIYKNILQISMNFVQSTEGYKYISDYQCKFVFGLQYLGIADCIGQAQGADDMTVMAAFAAKTADSQSSEPIFNWTAEEAGEMFRKMTEVQAEDWAFKIIVNGGNAVSETLSKDENKDMLPLLKVFDDIELMKEVAKNVLP